LRTLVYQSALPVNVICYMYNVLFLLGRITANYLFKMYTQGEVTSH